ncbi:TPA: sodium:proton antiporter [Candidatus Galligastranaerophilus intestinavium]|uniref:Sodium:proton antiporter n=1 Tax=Candidatus Galligastranaerophilus intestinavium TaxID=2840836 RepID=A0A9D1FJ39_9BACT|nr:sodium:proton antiporter [Candidatus Galligastranaerophilus intestinavium]
MDNVTTVILILPITFAIAKKLDINPLPYLIVEIFASNIGGTATLIGDPPNIIIGSAAGFSFMDFIKELTGIVAVILLAVVCAMYLMFRKQLVTTEEKMKSVLDIDNSKTIEDIPLMIRSLVVLSLVILGFVLHDTIHLETSIVAMMGACALLLFEKPTDILRDVEWNAIFFFIGLFVIIGALEASGGIKLMAQWLIDVTQGSKTLTCSLVLWISGIASGIIDNIPYTATMAPLIAEIERELGSAYAYPIWWSLSLGACLGGNLTIIGAAANVYVSENAANKGYPIGFLHFMKYGAICVLISLVLSSAYIYLRFLR